MSRPPRARERVLDAFQTLLISDGERAATLEAVAASAGVSKGGLLYHFSSKEDLKRGLIQRLFALVDEDVLIVRAAPEGPVSYYLRESVMEDTPLDHALIAIARLAQGGDPEASAALNETRRRWAETIRPAVRDEASLDLVMLVSDGLYFNNVLADQGTAPQGAALDALVALVIEATSATTDAITPR